MAEAQPNEAIEVSRREGVVQITLARPRRKNAFDATMRHELLETLGDVATSADDRVVVLTGAGGDFCSGADLLDGATDDRHGLVKMREINLVCLALHRLPQPTIAKVRGVAVGAGFNLALGCDLLVAAEDARFSQIFARRGLSIDFGGSWLLPRRIGLHKAKELALLAHEIDAVAAAELGVVNRVVADEELDEVVADWARRLATGPPIALALTKALLDNAFEVTLDQALDDEARAQTMNFATGDTAEAMAAFVEKREPVFRGR